MKLGPSKGNPGAIIRWGKYLDKGIWIRAWNFRSLWFSWYIRARCISLGFIVFHF